MPISGFSVLLVSHSAMLGGAERSLLETARALRTADVRLRVLLPEAGPLEDSLAQLGVPSFRVAYRPWVSRAGHPIHKRVARRFINLAALPVLLTHIMREPTDLVYTNSMTIAIASLAAWLARTPHLWHLREYGRLDHGLEFDLGDKVSLRVMRCIGGSFVANSKTLAEYYADRLRRPAIPFVYQPVAFPWSEGLHAAGGSRSKGPADFECLLLGALQEGKGQRDAIEAVAALRTWGIPVHLRLAGPAAEGYRVIMEELVRSLGLEGAVTIQGSAEDVGALYAASDVVLVCSRSEAFGRVTVEAMKAGRPVIGAKSGGTAELIRDDETGLLYEPGDPVKLAEKIRYLADNPGERARLSANAERWAWSEFTEEAFRHRLLATIRQAARGPR